MRHLDSVFLYIESNGIFAILLIVLLIKLGRKPVSIWEEKLFKRAIYLNIAVLIADTGTWIFDGYIALDTIWINKLVFCAYYMLTSAFVFVWMLYTICKLRAKPKRIKRIMPLIAIPMYAGEIIAITSLWTGSFYRFDDQGNYIRGDLFWAHTAMLWVYFAIVIIYAVYAFMKNDGHKRTKEVKSIIIAALFPVIGGVLQTIYYGLNLAWTASCISFVIIFINIQNKQALTDALTGIYNRGAFTEYLAESVNGLSKNERLYLIMMDINRFKMINDTFGHTVGDDALKATSKMLSRVVKLAGEGDFLARYGGDEFALICHRRDRSEIEKLVERIREESKSLQKEMGMNSPITISIGYAEYHNYLYDTEEAFIEEADRRMYTDKAKSREGELKED